jgi:NAD(P)H-dependent FMN reductase
MPMNFVIIFGSVRTERQGIKVARFIDAQIRSRGHTTALIDPMVYRLPLLDRTRNMPATRLRFSTSLRISSGRPMAL